MFQGQRDESTKVDKELAKTDAKELHEVEHIFSFCLLNLVLF